MTLSPSIQRLIEDREVLLDMNERTFIEKMVSELEKRGYGSLSYQNERLLIDLAPVLNQRLEQICKDEDRNFAVAWLSYDYQAAAQLFSDYINSFPLLVGHGRGFGYLLSIALPLFINPHAALSGGILLQTLWKLARIAEASATDRGR